MNAAEELISEVGASVPLDKVARLAGVSGSTLYRNFRDRDDLLDALSARYAARIEAIGQQMSQAADADETVRTLVQGMAEALLASPAAPAVLEAIRAGRARDGSAPRPGSQYEPMLQAVVQHAIAEGALHPSTTFHDLLSLAYAAGALPAHMVHHHHRERLIAAGLAGLRPRSSLDQEIAATALTRPAPAAPQADVHD